VISILFLRIARDHGGIFKVSEELLGFASELIRAHSRAISIAGLVIAAIDLVWLREGSENKIGLLRNKLSAFLAARLTEANERGTVSYIMSISIFIIGSNYVILRILNTPPRGTLATLGFIMAAIGILI
jgi:hypothetical protein